MTKYDIGYDIEHNGEYYKGLLITLYDAGNYNDAKQVLLDMLEKRQFWNVTIVK